MKTIKINLEISLQSLLITAIVVAIIAITVFNIITIGFPKP